MDDNFSPKVKDVIASSKEEALRLGHDFIGTEHLMLGLLRDGSSKAVNILGALSIDLELIRRKVEILNPSDHENTNFNKDKKNLHLTRQAERALKTTFLEAKLFQSSLINTAHLLLCILRNENDPTTKLLNKLKVDYDNVKEQDYPHILVTTGYHDSQVQYWEPAKWVAKLREHKTDDNSLLFYTEMDAGHSGSSGRFSSIKETARDFAFIIDSVNKNEK